jgi:hypothetical protein
MTRIVERHTVRAKAFPERELLKGALGALEEATGTTAHIVDWEHKFPEGQADAVLELIKGHNKVRYIAEVKLTLPPAAIGHVVAQMHRFTKPGLLITRYITPPMAERLKRLDVAFIDTAGNAYINTPKLFVYVTGRKAPEKEDNAHRVKAFRPTGLQVIFTLLCLPEMIKAPYRDIAKAADVALGTVGWVMYDLKRLNYLAERGKLGRKLLNTHALLNAWVTAYAQQLRPKLYVGRYRAPQPDWWKNVDWKKYDTFLGGEPAAARLTQHLKPEKITLYAPGDVNDFLIKHRLKKDPDGNIEVLKTFWHFDYPWNHPQLAPPLLVYADLMATADERNIETGKLIYEKYLARLVKQD